MESAQSKSQEASSSSSHKNNSEQNKQEQVDNGKEDKKLKMESTNESEEQFVVNETSINELPPEMLVKILKHLDTKNLSACRLMNRQWNGIAIEAIKLRADVEIGIYGSQKSITLQAKGKNGKSRNLSNFIKSFDQSKNFPFSRFLCQVDNSTFKNKTWMKFIVGFGENIKCLNLKINPISKDGDLIKLTKNLNNLLLNQLPNLQELDVNLSDCKTPNSSTIQLFPNPNPAKALAIQLPHLKVIDVNQYAISNHTGIVTDLLQAAVNLQKFWIGSPRSIENLYFLQSLGKLHCVQDIEMDLSPEFFSQQTKAKPQAPLVFQLKDLDLYLTSVYDDENIWSTSASFLSNLFETSKDTLSELNTDPLGFFHELQLPKFTNLSTMLIYGNEEEFIQILEPIVPSGIKLENTFPALNSLALQIPFTAAFPPEHCNSIIPALETLKVTKKGLNNNSIAQISSVFPNLKHLEIANFNKEGQLENFPDVGTAIWTHLKKLHSLKLEIDADSVFNTFPAVVSCITGISKEDSARLYDLVQAEKSLRKWNSQARVSQSELEAERKNVSILDLKDLKELTIGLFWTHEDEVESREDLAKKALTFVCEEYALKLVDNLKYKINRHVKRI